MYHRVVVAFSDGVGTSVWTVTSPTIRPARRPSWQECSQVSYLHLVWGPTGCHAHLCRRRREADAALLPGPHNFHHVVTRASARGRRRVPARWQTHPQITSHSSMSARRSSDGRTARPRALRTARQADNQARSAEGRTRGRRPGRHRRVAGGGRRRGTTSRCDSRDRCLTRNCPQAPTRSLRSSTSWFS